MSRDECRVRCILADLRDVARMLAEAREVLQAQSDRRP